MKFLADENIPLEVIEKLQEDNIDIISVTDFEPGIEDIDIIHLANKEKRVLLTFDKDFGELIYKMKYKIFGIILFRLHPVSVDFIFKKITLVLKKDVPFEGHFCVVELDRLRVRPLGD